MTASDEFDKFFTPEFKKEFLAGGASVEPDAITRMAAQSAWNIYQGYHQAGFSPEQTMQILLMFMQNAFATDFLKKYLKEDPQ